MRQVCFEPYTKQLNGKTQLSYCITIRICDDGLNIGCGICGIVVDKWLDSC